MNFYSRAIAITNQIPVGKVTSYGYVATLAGSPRAARQVGWALASLGLQEQSIPWWRVVNSKGYLSIRGSRMEAKFEQKALLEAEGVQVDQDFCVDLNGYGWFGDVPKKQPHPSRSSGPAAQTASRLRK